MTNRRTHLARWLAALAPMWLLLGATPRAIAHPDLDQATQFAAALELDAALVAFQAALDSGALTREELISLLSERALVLHALQREDELAADFLWLSALSPSHQLDPRAPPELTSLWASLRDRNRGALGIELNAERDADGEIEASAVLNGTVPPGARAMLWMRKPGGQYRLLSQPGLHVAAETPAEFEFYAQAAGLGNVMVAQAFGPDAPLRISTKTAAPREPEKSAAPPDEAPSWASRHKPLLWGAGAAALVAGAVLTAVLVTRARDQSSERTHLMPMVEF